MAYKFNMEFQKSDEGALFLFHFFKKFWPDRFDTPPLPEFLPRNSVYRFWTTFSKNRLGFASVLGRIWALVLGIKGMTRRPIQAETWETSCRKSRRCGEDRSRLLPLLESSHHKLNFDEIGAVIPQDDILYRHGKNTPI